MLDYLFFLKEDMSKQQNMIESLEDILKTRKVEVLDRFETLKRQNDASLTDYQQHVKAYISTVDTISASARALDEQCLDEEDGLATFIQVHTRNGYVHVELTIYECN